MPTYLSLQHFFPDVNSRYWFKPIKPSRVLCVLDNVVLTDEGTWGAAANHHYITIMFGCGCNYLYHRDLHLVLRSLHKNLVSYDSYRILSRNSLNSILFDSYINHHEAKLPINWEHKLKALRLHHIYHMLPINVLHCNYLEMFMYAVIRDLTKNKIIEVSCTQ